MIKFWKRYKGRKIFKSMFIACSSLAAVCILTACISGYFWFYMTQLEEEKNTDCDVLYASSLMIENYISTVKDTMEVLNSDTYVRRLLAKNEYSWDDNMSIAAQQILNTVAVNPMFHSIYLLGEEEYLIKSTNPSYPLNKQADDMMQELFYQGSFGEFTSFYYLDVYGKPQSLLCLLEGEKNPINAKKEAGVLISVDIGSIMNCVFPEYREEEEYLLLNKAGRIIYACGTRYQNGDELEEGELLFYINNCTNRTSSVISDGENKRLVTCIPIEDEFYLVHILPYHYILEPIHQMRGVFAVIGIGLVLLILLLAFGMSNWVYSPIDAVVQTANAGQAVEEKGRASIAARVGKTELASLAESYSSMVKDLNDLNMQKDQVELAAYLTNRTPVNNLPEWIEDTYRKDGIKMRLLCMRISDANDFNANNTQEAIAFEIQAIINIIKQIWKPYGDILTCPVDKEYIAVLIFTEKSLEEQEVILKTKETVRIVKELLSVGMDAGISNEKENFEELSAMYQMARAATAYRFMYGVNAVITENQMTERALSHKEGLDTNILMKKLKELDREGFEQEYQRIIQELKGYSLQAAREVLISMAAEIQKVSNSLNYSFVSLSNSDFEKINSELMQFEYIEDVREWFYAMVDKIWIAIMKAKQSGRDDIADKAMCYLNENYADSNISAQYLADMYHITPSYFSRIFNERSGYAFPDYLATLRIERAKDMLLTDQNKSIQEICEMVGYTNSSYFTASFKKKFGITPGQFRKKHQINDENQ